MESKLDLDILKVFKDLKEPTTYTEIRNRLLFHGHKADRVRIVQDEYRWGLKGKRGNGLVPKSSFKRPGGSFDEDLPAAKLPSCCSSSVMMVDLTDNEQEEERELRSSLREMFPSLDKGFIAQKAKELTGRPSLISNFIEEHTQEPASTSSKSPPPKEEEDDSSKESAHQALTAIFPKVDPQYLFEKVEQFLGKEAELQAWISGVMESNTSSSLPSLADYEKRQQQEELIQKFSREGDVKELVELYGNPIQHFTQGRGSLSNAYRSLSLAYLSLEFRFYRKKFLEATLLEQNGRFLGAYLYLKNLSCDLSSSWSRRKSKRHLYECAIPEELDIAFLKEYQVAKKVDEITEYLNVKQMKRMQQIEGAKESCSLKNCECCFEDELLAEELVSCPEGHQFCKDCILRASEVALGDGKSGLSCLASCEATFKLSTLQASLPVNLFSKWLPRIQNAEVKDASLEGVSECPFCPYMTIIDTSPSENKVLICMNPECGKESCRLCKELSHIPLHCDEVEKNDEVRKRTFIENKMTEALVRTCPKCSKKFYKDDGCNKITCTCGTQICYLCRKVISTGYKHFYGQGGKPMPGLCPLFSNNAKLMENDIARGAAEGMREAEENQPHVPLKIDPTAGVSKKVLKDSDPQLVHHQNIIQDQFPGLPPEQVWMEQAEIEREILDPRRPDPMGLLGLLRHNFNGNLFGFP